MLSLFFVQFKMNKYIFRIKKDLCANTNVLIYYGNDSMKNILLIFDCKRRFEITNFYKMEG
jgi:hypothetical protein